MQIQTKSGDTHIWHQHHVFLFIFAAYDWCAQHLVTRNHIIRMFRKMSMSVSAVAGNILMFSSFMRLFFHPTTAQRVDPAPTPPETHYLFIITAASQQWLSTQKPLGGDWVPDLVWLRAARLDLSSVLRQTLGMWVWLNGCSREREWHLLFPPCEKRMTCRGS